MNLKLAKEQDAHDWNNVVKSKPESLFFDLYEWNQALGYAFDHIRPSPLIIKDDSDIVGVFPACVVQNRLYSTVESLPFSDYGGGPIFRQKKSDEDFIINFINNLINYFENQVSNCIKITIRRSYFKDLIKSSSIDKKIEINNINCSFLIDLSKDFNDIMKDIKKNRLKSIKKGQRYNINIREDVTIKDLDIFYQIYSDHMKRINSKPLSYSLLKYLWDNYQKTDKVKLFIAEDKQIIGGIFVLNYNGVSHGWACGVQDEARKKNPMDLLILHSIKWAYNNKFKYLDLGSTMNDPASGHYYYKNSWGGIKKNLFNYQIILKPNLWKLYKYYSGARIQNESVIQR